jgi:phospholipase/carboxylesterase
MPYIDLSQMYRPAEGFYSSEVGAARRLPIRTFLPTGYEPYYAYPLLVFFHGQGSNEDQVIRLAPRLSRRNFVCIGLRGGETIGARPDGKIGYGWGSDPQCDAQLEDYVFGAIEQTRRNYHVHSERIYLAGICEGALAAYRLALTFPQKFSGVISLNGCLPPRGSLFFRLAEIRQLSAFIGHGIANATVPLSIARENFRLLYTAGLDIHMFTYPTTHRLHPHMLRDINRWVIDRCNE